MKKRKERTTAGGLGVGVRWRRQSNVQVSRLHAASAAPLSHFANEAFLFCTFFLEVLNEPPSPVGSGRAAGRGRGQAAKASSTGEEGVHPFQCKATNALLFTCTSTD